MTNHPNRSRAPSLAQTPPPDLIRDTRMAARLSQREAAELVLSTTRAWQGWEADPDSNEHRRMPPGLWLLFRCRILATTGNAAGAMQLLQLEDTAP